MLSDDITALVVTARHPLQSSCDLCARSNATLRATVSVLQSSGASASFRACERCERALRRLAAATHGLTRFVTRDRGVRVTLEPESGSSETLAAAGLPPGAVIQEYLAPLQDAAGTLFLPRVCGAQREDGTWIGWVEFVEVDGDGLLRTSRETTQPNRAALHYWASRLQPTYLEGSFSRAQRPHVLRLT